MDAAQRRAIATIALHAAFADGTKSDAERDEIRRVAETLDGDMPVAALYSDVLLGKAPLESVTGLLTEQPHRQLAFELAVGVIDADGLRNAQETAFLDRLGSLLRLESQAASAILETADDLATAPLEDPGGLLASPGAASAASTGPAPAAPAVDETEIDRMIVRAAILNGALELLPQSMASLAIVPLQMKLVYGIGERYGQSLDRGQIKDLLATLGVGVTGQYLEDVGRKLIGGLLGKVGGGLLGGLGRGATGMAFSFATTWAIGQVARRYYAGGRNLSAQMLKESFDTLLAEGRTLQQRYAPQIQEQAGKVDLPSLLRSVRGRA